MDVAMAMVDVDMTNSEIADGSSVTTKYGHYRHRGVRRSLIKNHVFDLSGSKNYKIT